MHVKGEGVHYFGEIFAKKRSVCFDNPQLWLLEKVKIGT
jgi:hypothetical protein